MNLETLALSGMAALAVYRVARMVALEEGPFALFERVRDWAGAYEYGENGLPVSNLGRGISCTLCVAVWVAAPMACLVIWKTAAGVWVIVWLALSGAQVLLDRRLEGE